MKFPEYPKKSLQLLLFLGLVLASGCTVYQAPTKPGTSPAELNLPSGNRKVYMEEETPAGETPRIAIRQLRQPTHKQQRHCLTSLLCQP